MKKQKIMSMEKQNMKKLKNSVKRNNTNSVSSNNNCFINISRRSAKFNNGTKWNNIKSSRSK